MTRPRLTSKITIRAEAARLEVGVAHSARNTARSRIGRFSRTPFFATDRPEPSVEGLIARSVFFARPTPFVDGDAKHTRRSRHARRPKDALRHVRTPFRAEAARLEVGVARSARNAARFADRDRRYRLFGFSILAAVSFLVSRAARFASAGRGAKSAFDLIPPPEAFPVL